MTHTRTARLLGRRLFLGAGAAVLLAACGQPAAPPAGTPAGAPTPTGAAGAKPAPTSVPPKLAAGQILVAFGSQGDQNEIKMFDEVLDAFEAKNAKIRVDRKYDPTLTWPKIINMIRTGNAADFQRTDDDSIWVLTAANALTILEDHFKRDLKRDDYFPITFQRRQGPGGELASAYVASYPVVAIYNMELFRKHGVNPPMHWDQAWTMEEFDKVLGQLTERAGDRTNVFGWTAPDWWIPVALWNEGVPFWNDDETKAVFDTPEGLKVAEMWQSWFRKGYAVPPGENVTQLFNSGLLAIRYEAPIVAYSYRNVKNLEVGPTWMGSKHKATTHAGRTFSIPASSKVKDEAWELAKWWWTQTPDGKDGGQAIIAKYDWGVPTLKAAADGPYMKSSPTRPYKNVELLRKSMDMEAVPWPRNPASESFMIPWRRLSAMNTDQMAPKEFLQKEAEAFLTQVLRDTDWNKSKDKPGFRSEGVIEKSQAEK